MGLVCETARPSWQGFMTQHSFLYTGFGRLWTEECRAGYSFKRADLSFTFYCVEQECEHNVSVSSMMLVYALCTMRTYTQVNKRTFDSVQSVAPCERVSLFPVYVCFPASYKVSIMPFTRQSK